MSSTIYVSRDFKGDMCFWLLSLLSRNIVLTRKQPSYAKITKHHLETVHFRSDVGTQSLHSPLLQTQHHMLPATVRLLLLLHHSWCLLIYHYVFYTALFWFSLYYRVFSGRYIYTGMYTLYLSVAPHPSPSSKQRTSHDVRTSHISGECWGRLRFRKLQYCNQLPS